MSVVLEQIVTPGFRAGLYLGNALWHSSAVYHFGFKPEFMMRKLTSRVSDIKTIETPEGDKWHHDIMRYLGGINLGYAVLATLRFIPLIGVVRSKGPDALPASAASKEVQAALDVLALSVLGLANASQAFANFFVARPSKRWRFIGTWQGLQTDRITLFDALFTILDFAVVGARIAGY